MIEVLVALVILGAAIAVILTGLESAEIGTTRACDQAESLDIAQSLIAVEGTHFPLRFGETSGDTVDGYQWTVFTRLWKADDATKPPLMGAYWIEVRVVHDGHSLDLTTLKPGPAPNAS